MPSSPGAVAVPVEPAAVPPLLVDVPAGDEAVPAEAPCDVDVVSVVVVDEPDEDVAPWARTSAPAGTVSGGAEAGMWSTPVLSPPQPAAPAESARATRARTRADRRDGDGMGTRLERRQDASGAMRRPHVGQSLRSRWASWSHQLQNRRFSTAQGRRDARRAPWG